MERLPAACNAAAPDPTAPEPPLRDDPAGAFTTRPTPARGSSRCAVRRSGNGSSWGGRTPGRLPPLRRAAGARRSPSGPFAPLLRGLRTMPSVLPPAVPPW